jgi:hypothetical protein
MNYWLGVIGMWFVCDGIISLSLYLPTTQTWRRDHWVRAVRLWLGLVLIGMGWGGWGF